MDKQYVLDEEEYNEYIYLKTLKKALELEAFEKKECPNCKYKN